ncbi:MULTISPECIES: hypothetical protein [Ruminococcus]|uniref:Uncharacterized protein n=1 Tax=Ruminococcus albus (strain ATCC 27210 / DSM 20455 / JCM 14654 / NCDO 2250 / 7) TaxID=697329 RepID=E6UFP4_RUMA7|nr:MULTISPECIES: hypothetical protein [Ruminococcus]ADU23033.1 hypothetical protein Rumal_2558 [Ruminococcus albus 7 = DSM 20455]MCR5022104.1 hypothetical protein [Ruminococcus sp.]
MRSKLYYTAKKVTVAAWAVLLFPLMWRIVSSYMLANSFNNVDPENYGWILLAGKAVALIAAGVSFILAVIGGVLSGMSVKRKDIGAGKLLAADIVLALITGAVIGVMIWYIKFFRSLSVVRQYI